MAREKAEATGEGREMTTEEGGWVGAAGEGVAERVFSACTPAGDRTPEAGNRGRSGHS